MTLDDQDQLPGAPGHADPQQGREDVAADAAAGKPAPNLLFGRP
jgi:hypothetical protein